jgi:hypothetical protein
MTETILQLVCACDCGRPITTASPSPWWAGDDCFATWATVQAGIAADAQAELAEAEDFAAWDAAL